MQIENIPTTKGPDAGTVGRKSGRKARNHYATGKAQYNPSLKLAIDISRVLEAPIEEIFIFE